ncbi:MAG: hypothetical protein OXE50_00330 [Chloroflexi bacterium]|nr:hypothetical protein [Chloroflexota bacterium]
MDDDTDRELRPPPRFLDGFPQDLPVILEGVHPLDDQTLSDQRVLFRFARALL